jgi:hypothetical protein
MQIAMFVRCGIFASFIAVLMMGSVAVEAGKSGSVQRVQHVHMCMDVVRVRCVHLKMWPKPELRNVSRMFHHLHVHKDCHNLFGC